MAKTRRSHTEVLQARIDLLKQLEAELALVEKEKAKAANPLSLLLAAKVAILGAQITSVVRAFRKRK